MQRVMIIGCCGSGKSTFSRALHKVLGLELIHLDQYYWQPNWVEMEKTHWAKTVTELASKPHWIIDGNYGGTMDLRFEKADTIFFLDIPTYKCLWRITKRIYKYHGKVRPDMPEGCKERFDLEFYHYVLTYNMIRRKSLLNKLNNLSNKKIVVIKNDKEADAYIDNLKAIHS